ncbi:hypothetical protein PT287_07780 [Lactobacillus sp. ESL0679]|uniref:hypothetical protein n=1 Tax=Lactobacillus sp. ESL0679 TaxID=2983209 RepID=UPI0023F82DC1|nr:hypothetical protein [Lactobacillus sp. ESL0679]MDF7683399.1 hypothetical protein [Lactobacillus sp. ESL0679]
MGKVTIKLKNGIEEFTCNSATSIELINNFLVVNYYDDQENRTTMFAADEVKKCDAPQDCINFKNAAKIAEELISQIKKCVANDATDFDKFDEETSKVMTDRDKEFQKMSKENAAFSKKIKENIDKYLAS